MSATLEEVKVTYESDLDDDDGVEITLIGGPHSGEKHRMPSSCPCCGARDYQFMTQCCASVYEIVVDERRGYYVAEPGPHAA